MSIIYIASSLYQSGLQERELLQTLKFESHEHTHICGQYSLIQFRNSTVEIYTWGGKIRINLALQPHFSHLPLLPLLPSPLHKPMPHPYLPNGELVMPKLCHPDQKGIILRYCEERAH